MPTFTKGYKTASGRFFETMEEAELQEAEDELWQAIEDKDILSLDLRSLDPFLTAVRSLATPLLRYLQAYRSPTLMEIEYDKDVKVESEAIDDKIEGAIIPPETPIPGTPQDDSDDDRGAEPYPLLVLDT